MTAMEKSGNVQIQVSWPVSLNFGLFGSFRLYRPMSFLLHVHGLTSNCVTVRNISYPDFNEITASEFAIDGQVEQGKISNSIGIL